MAHLEMDPLISRKTWNTGTWKLFIWIQHILINGTTVTPNFFMDDKATFKIWIKVTLTLFSFSQAAFNLVTRKINRTDIPLRYIILQNLGLIHDGFRVPWKNFFPQFIYITKRHTLIVTMFYTTYVVNNINIIINSNQTVAGSQAHRGIYQEFRTSALPSIKFNISCLSTQLQKETTSKKVTSCIEKHSATAQFSIKQKRFKSTLYIFGIFFFDMSTFSSRTLAFPQLCTQNRGKSLRTIYLRFAQSHIPSRWYTTFKLIKRWVTKTKLPPPTLLTLSGVTLRTIDSAAIETTITIINGVMHLTRPPPARLGIGNLASHTVDKEPFQVYHV